MAARDIMPFRTSHGGTRRTRTYHLLAGETFAEGEVVRLETASGQLCEAADDPDICIHQDGGAVGVAAEPAQGMAADAAGVTNPDFANRAVWIWDNDQEWITPNVSSSGTHTADFTNDMVHANTGAPVGLMRNTFAAAVRWGVTTVGTNLQFRITDLLDANKQSIRDATTVATWVVFAREESSEIIA